MTKTKFERELERKPQGALIAYCDQRDLDHTGDREALIARLVEWEKAQPKETESEVEPVVSELED